VLRVLLVCAAVAIGLFAIDRLALWAEKRGWIYWRHTPRPRRTAVGAVMGELLETLQPMRHTIVEESDRQRLDIQYPGNEAPPDVDLGTGPTRPS
jgi:hypothetical protein